MVFAQEVVEMWSVPAQRVVGDHEVVFDKRKLKQPVSQKAHVSHTFTQSPGGPRQPSHSKHWHRRSPRPAVYRHQLPASSPLLNDPAPRVRGVDKVPQVVVGYDDPVRLFRQVEQEPERVREWILVGRALRAKTDPN